MSFADRRNQPGGNQGYQQQQGYGQQRGQGYGQQAQQAPAARGQQGGYQSRDANGEYSRSVQQISNYTYTINNNVGEIQKMADMLGSDRDNEQLRNHLRQLQEQTTTIIRDASATIKSLVAIAGSSSGSEASTRRIQVDKLQKDLQTALQKFQVCSQVTVSKERSTLSQTRDRVATRDTRNQYNEDYDRRGERAPLMDDGQQQQQRSRQVHMDQEIDFNTNLIVEREDAIREIEVTMREVNEIYSDLNALVIEQGERLDIIENNMASVDDKVESGVKQLGNASHYQSKARNKACCLMVIVAIVAAILVVVLVTQLKKSN